MLKARRLLLPVLFILGCTGIIYLLTAADEMLLSRDYGNPHITGIFNTWGNAGSISFDNTPYGYSWAQIIGYGSSWVTLTGMFWMETTWWATFGESRVTIVAPSWGNNIRDPWYLSGYAWSPNAGWIALNHGESYASGIAFMPDISQLVWYGYSESLGWIPFWEYSGSGIAVNVSDWFIGKVSIAGSIWWSKTFNVLYDVGGTFNTVSMTAFVNLVRKNITILLRNAGSKINTNLTWVWAESFNKAMIFRIDNNVSSQFVRYSDVENKMYFDRSRSLIVIGADIYIDTDVAKPIGQSRAIIALKNEKGEWGNIYIDGAVKTIESVLFAEASIISGAEFITGSLSPYYVSKKSVFLDIPRNQLYIKWAIWGFNTIGWSSKNGGAVCPYLSDNSVLCSYDNSIKYDWNYFRIYNGSPARRAYPNDSKDSFSVIIEYDPRIIQDPPPGLETLN